MFNMDISDFGSFRTQLPSRCRVEAVDHSPEMCDFPSSRCVEAMHGDVIVPKRSVVPKRREVSARSSEEEGSVDPRRARSSEEEGGASVDRICWEVSFDRICWEVSFGCVGLLGGVSFDRICWEFGRIFWSCRSHHCTMCWFLLKHFRVYRVVLGRFTRSKRAYRLFVHRSSSSVDFSCIDSFERRVKILEMPRTDLRGRRSKAAD